MHGSNESGRNSPTKSIEAIVPIYEASYVPLVEIIRSSTNFVDFSNKVRLHIKNISKGDIDATSKIHQINLFLDALYVNNFDLTAFNFGNQYNIVSQNISLSQDNDADEMISPGEKDLQIILSALEPQLSQYTLVTEMLSLDYDLTIVREFTQIFEDHSYLSEKPSDPYPTLGQYFDQNPQDISS